MYVESKSFLHISYCKHTPVIYLEEVILTLLNENMKGSARSEGIAVSTYAPFGSRGLGIQVFFSGPVV